MGNHFFDVYLSIASKYPEMLLKDCYEMAEKWHKNKYGKRRYKNLGVFKTKFYTYIRKQKQKK